MSTFSSNGLRVGIVGATAVAVAFELWPSATRMSPFGSVRTSFGCQK